MLDFALTPHELFAGTVAAAVVGGLFNAAVYWQAYRRVADLDAATRRTAEMLTCLDREAQKQRAAAKELAEACDRLREELKPSGYSV